MSEQDHTPNNEHKQLIISDHIARREMALSEIARNKVYAGGIYNYLCNTQYVRHYKLSEETTLHALIDIVNIASQSRDVLRNLWRNIKTQLERDEIQLCQSLTQLKIPSWTDGKLYKVDMITDRWLVVFMMKSHLPLCERFQFEWATDNQKVPSEYREQILLELSRKVGWAGTRNRLEMKSIYEAGDYDNDIQPPGSPR